MTYWRRHMRRILGNVLGYGTMGVVAKKGDQAWQNQRVKVKTVGARNANGERIIKLNVRERMTNKVKEAFGGLISVIVLLFCACICGLILGGLILANIFLWHWIISML